LNEAPGTDTSPLEAGDRPSHEFHAPRLHPHGPLTTVRMLLEIVVIALFIVTFISQPTRIASASMYPTLKVGDMLFLDKQSYGSGAHASFMDALLPPEQIHRGDIIVFHYTVDPSLSLVKRVIGLPGDRIHLHNGRVFLNGSPLDEPYTYYLPSQPNRYRDNFPDIHDPNPNVDPRWWVQMRHSVENGEITVPPNHYFVLGDNRNNSEDSRYWGFVPRNAIIGRPLVVYFSTAETPEGSFLQRLAAALHQGWQSIRVIR